MATKAQQPESQNLPVKMGELTAPQFTEAVEKSNAELGVLIINSEVDQLVELISYLKESDEVLKLQNEFFERAEEPMNEYRD